MTESPLQKKKVAKMLQTLAAAYLANRQYENAIEKFLQLKGLGDEEPSTYVGLAGAYLALKQTSPQALQAYKLFCDFYPENGELISNIAALLLQNELRDEAALHIYRCAIAFHPSFEKDLHLLLLQAFEQSGDLALALQAARSAALLPGSDALAIRKLVALSWRQQRFDELIQELKMLPEQPLLAGEIGLYAALSLAHRSLQKKTPLSAKEIKSIKAAGAGLLPFKTIVQVRDYCTLFFALAHSHGPQASLVEEPVALGVKSEGRESENYYLNRSVVSTAGGKSNDLWNEFIRQINGLEAKTQMGPAINLRNHKEIIVADSPGPFTGEARAIMVLTLRAPLSSVDDGLQPRAAAGIDESVLAFFAELQTPETQARLFDDGLLVVSHSPKNLMQLAIRSLRSFTKEPFPRPGSLADSSILLHAMSEAADDDDLPAFALFNTALQVAGNLPSPQPPPDGESNRAQRRTRLFITQDALVSLQMQAERLLSNRRLSSAGIAGLAVNLDEVLWHNPFELADDRRPMSLGRFAVVKKLRSTEISTTFVARDPKLGVTAILKSLSPSGATPSDEEAMMEAIRRVGRLTHPGVALIHDMSKRDGFVYFVREFVEGHSLRDEASFANLQSLSKILTLGVQTCRTLHDAHRAGVLHLNLKPTNFWLTPEGAIKLTDFALPGARRSDFPTIEENSDDIYLAPEVRESAAASPASDVYSLAALLFLMIRNLPASETAMTDVILGLRSSPEENIPESIKEILFSAVAYDPLARPQSMAEFERHLRYCLAMLPPSDA